jgi:hypothetical protein
MARLKARLRLELELLSVPLVVELPELTIRVEVVLSDEVALTEVLVLLLVLSSGTFTLLPWLPPMSLKSVLSVELEGTAAVVVFAATDVELSGDVRLAATDPPALPFILGCLG